MSDSLPSPGLQHAKLLVFHYLLEFAQIISIGSVMSSNHLILCCHSFPASASFPVSCFFTSGSQSIGASVSASVLPMNIQAWFPLWWTGWISLQSKGLWRVFPSTIIWKHQFFGAQPSLWSTSHICTWLLEKLYLWLYRSLSAKWCLCFSSGRRRTDVSKPALV